MLGRLPLDPVVGQSCDQGSSLFADFPNSRYSQHYNKSFTSMYIKGYASNRLPYTYSGVYFIIFLFVENTRQSLESNGKNACKAKVDNCERFSSSPHGLNLYSLFPKKGEKNSMPPNLEIEISINTFRESCLNFVILTSLYSLAAPKIYTYFFSQSCRGVQEHYSFAGATNSNEKMKLSKDIKVNIDYFCGCLIGRHILSFGVVFV